MIRETSREAYASITRTLNARQRAVLDLLEGSPHPLTNKEIAEKLGWEINQTTPRTNELVAFGLAHEAGTRRDPKTHRKAITWAAGKKVEKPKMVPQTVVIDGVPHVRFVPSV